MLVPQLGFRRLSHGHAQERGDCGVNNKSVLCLVLLSSFGCADDAALRTVPPGARVYVNEKFVGLSPTTFLVGRFEGTHYRTVLDGYPPAEGQLESRIAPERIFATIMTVGIYVVFHGWHYYPPTVVDFGPSSNPSPETLGGSTNPSSPEDRLRHVQNMYDQRLINEQEYNRLRSEILHELSPSK
jgi:PEGA domain